MRKAELMSVHEISVQDIGKFAVWAVEPHPSLDYFVNDYSGDEKINKTWRPLREGVEFARAFLVVIGIKPAKRIIELPADFAGGIKIGECFWKNRAGADDFGGRLAGGELRFPRRHHAAQRGRTACRRSQIPRFNDVDACADERFKRRCQPRQREKTPRGSQNRNWMGKRFDARAIFRRVCFAWRKVKKT